MPEVFDTIRAVDPETIVRRLEKSAGGLTEALKWGKRLGVGAGVLGGAGYGGALAGHHAGLFNMGPTGPEGAPAAGASPDDLYRYHAGQATAQQMSHMQAVRESATSTDPTRRAELSRLIPQLSSGNYGGQEGSGWLVRNLAPFVATAANPNHAQHMQAATGAANQLQDEYAKNLGDATSAYDTTKSQLESVRSGGIPALPGGREPLEQSLQSILDTLHDPRTQESPQVSAVRSRMQALGLTPRAPGAASPSAPPAMSSPATPATPPMGGGGGGWGSYPPAYLAALRRAGFMPGPTSAAHLNPRPDAPANPNINPAAHYDFQGNVR